MGQYDRKRQDNIKVQVLGLGLHCAQAFIIQLIMKPKSFVWRFFNKLIDKENHTAYTCRYCSAKYKSAHATRLKDHLMKCPSCPLTVKALFNKGKKDRKCSLQSSVSSVDETASDSIHPITHAGKLNSQVEKSNFPIEKLNLSVERVSGDQNDKEGQAAGKNTCEKTSSVKQYIDSMCPEEQVNLDTLFARAIYASSTALSLFENIYWKQFFAKLRPSWQQPSLYKLGTPLLAAEFTKIEQKVATALADAKTVAVECDGWSNKRYQSIVHFIVTTPKPILYETKCTGADSHTGEYLANMLLDVIERIEPAKVLAVITDSASAMIKARGIINEKYPHISVYSCASHNLNSLIGDILKLNTFKLVTNNAKEIVKEINSSHALRATFLEIQDDIVKENKTTLTKNVSLKLPGKTRWGSVIFCGESLLYNKAALKRLAITDEVMLKSDVQANILDDSFWCGLLSLHEIVAPIVKWITILEGDYCTLSLVPKAFFEIKACFEERLPQSPIFEQESEIIQKQQEKRKNFLLKPIHFAAHMLDPQFLTSNFTPSSLHGEMLVLTRNQKLLGTEMIFNRVSYLYGEESDQATDVSVEFADFKEQTGVFGKLLLRKSIPKLDSVTWWRSNPFDSVLSSVASDILSMPASTAATERTFSKYGNVHTNKRNRLTTERAGRLTYVAHNLKLDDEPKSFQRREKDKYKKKLLMFVTPWNEKEFEDIQENLELLDEDEFCEANDDNYSDEDTDLDSDLDLDTEN